MTTRENLKLANRYADAVHNSKWFAEQVARINSGGESGELAESETGKINGLVREIKARPGFNHAVAARIAQGILDDLAANAKATKSERRVYRAVAEQLRQYSHESQQMPAAPTIDANVQAASMKAEAQDVRRIRREMKARNDAMFAEVLEESMILRKRVELLENLLRHHAPGVMAKEPEPTPAVAKPGRAVPPAETAIEEDGSVWDN